MIAPVSIIQARIRSLWLVSRTSLSFSDDPLSHHEYIDWRPGPWYTPHIAVRRRQVCLGSISTVLGRDMQKMDVVVVDAVDLLGYKMSGCLQRYSYYFCFDARHTWFQIHLPSLTLGSSFSSSLIGTANTSPTCTCKSCTMPTRQRKRRSYAPAPAP